MAVRIEMDIPKSCKECRFLWPSKGCFVCLAISDYSIKPVREKELSGKRPDWCLLKECK